MPMLAKQSPINTTRTKKPLIEHHFDDPVLQAEFDALTNNEDRLDFIEDIKGIGRIKVHGTVSFEEMKSKLRAWKRGLTLEAVKRFPVHKICFDLDRVSIESSIW
ncbi:MAG: hypothetical protein M0Z78_05675 [Betaproteobacteria bacterium]|nr:hypothetical protein [Betaproteobacteria bacterium]